MEKVRDIGVLLPLIKEKYNEVIDCKTGFVGLCYISLRSKIDGLISFEERLVVKAYLRSNIPEDIHPFRSSGNCYWYKLKDVKSRNDWLDKHIKLNARVRDIGVLLPLVKEQFIKIMNTGVSRSGICAAVASLYIRNSIKLEEKLNVDFYLIANIPSGSKDVEGVGELNYYWFNLNDTKSRIKLNTDINGKEKD